MCAESPPQFPRVRGDYQMTQGWRVSLPDEYAKRFEKRETGTDLVLWRPGITCWTTVYNQKKGETTEASYEWWKARTSDEAAQVFEFREGMPLRFGYLLHENPSDAPERWALYTFTFGRTGLVMMAIYFDRKEDLDTAKKIWLSIAETEE